MQDTCKVQHSQQSILAKNEREFFLLILQLSHTAFKGCPQTLICTWCSIFGVCAPRLSVAVGCSQCCYLQPSYFPVFRGTVLTYLWIFNRLINLGWVNVGVVIFKNLEYLHCNRIHVGSIILVHHNIECIPSKNYILHFISVV